MTLQEVIATLKKEKEKADEEYNYHGADAYDEVCIIWSSRSDTLEEVIKMLEGAE